MPGPFDMGANALLGIGQNTVRPIDAGDRISQFASTQNALLGNQVQQAEFDAKKAQGAAYAHHYNHLTGQYDMPAVQQEMGSTAAGQYGLPEAVTTVRSQQTQQIANDTNQLGLNQRRAGILAGILAPYANREGLTKQDLAPAYGSAIAHGLIGIDQANQSYASLPANGDALRDQVRGLYGAASGPEHAYNDAYGSMQMVDNGGVLQWQRVGSPASGQGGQAVGAGVARQTSPEFNATPTEIVNQDGSHSYVRRDAVVGGRPTVPPEAMGSGRYPGGNQPAQPSANPGYQISPAAGQVEALASNAHAGAEGVNALMQTSANRNDRLAILGAMETDLEGFTSGPGHERLRHIAATWNNWTPYSINVGEDAVEKAQSFNKWGQNLANAQSQALGAGTDSKLAAAVHANPNSALQEGTNRMMLHQLMGNEDAINAKAQAWQKSGLQPSQYQQWNQQFSQNFDPRAFQILRMTPSERHDVFQGLKKSGQMDDFKRSYNAMAAAGLVPSGKP